MYFLNYLGLSNILIPYYNNIDIFWNKQFHV